MKQACVLLLLIALAGCSDDPKTATETTKKTPEKLAPITGREAFYKMFPQARTWATDAQGLECKSVQISTVKADKGKAAVWQCVFVSESRGRKKGFTWSAVEGDGYHQNVFAGSEESYSASRQSSPFQPIAIKIDSDAALDTVVKKSPPAQVKKAEESSAVNFVLEQTPRFPNLVWRVIWGESVATAGYAGTVDAVTGDFLGH